jgi:hypothetical protein
MKNGINTDQFRVKTRSHGNGRKNRSGLRKYGNKWTKVENGTCQNGKFFIRFQRYSQELHARVVQSEVKR